MAAFRSTLLPLLLRRKLCSKTLCPAAAAHTGTPSPPQGTPGTPAPPQGTTGTPGTPAPPQGTPVLTGTVRGTPVLTGTVRGTPVLTGTVDRFGGVTVNLADTDLPADISESAFSNLLQDSLARWRSEGRVAVWLHVPIALSRCAAPAHAHGFTYHHAVRERAVLALWLAGAPSRLPGFATHQIGVAGAVVDEASGKVLVVQDKNKTRNAWKFPGGLSDPGEDIGATALREVLEETGVRARFRSLLAVRQQHRLPGAFGVSDLYAVCRLSPLSYAITLCTQECARCEWLPLAELARSAEATPITARLARLLLHGLEHGFQHIDLPMEELGSSGSCYQLYHRQLEP